MKDMGTIKYSRQLSEREEKERADEIAKWAKENWGLVEKFKWLLEAYNEK